MTEPARPLAQRKIDSLHRLRSDKDLWVASCDSSGSPYLVPLSFFWNEESIFVATVKTNPTAQNIVDTGRARVALGHTRDVTLIEARAKQLENDELKPEYGDAYFAKCGWDPRKAETYRFYLLQPQHIEAWREENEHAERILMDDARWVV